MFQGKFDEEGPFPPLALVSLATLIPPAPTMRALLVVLAEGNLALLAVLVNAGLSLRTPE